MGARLFYLKPIGTKAPHVVDAFTIAGFGSWIVGDTSSDDNPGSDLYHGTNHIMVLVNNIIFSAGESGTSQTSFQGQNSLGAPGDSGGLLMIGDSLVGIENWGANNLGPDDFDRFHGEISSPPTTSTYGRDQDAAIGHIADLASIKQGVQSGRKMAIDAHLNLTNPVYQAWLKGLDLNIRFNNCP